MDQGTYYLYKYNSGQPLCCAGFIRVTEHYHSCLLQIRARTGCAGDEASFRLSAFILAGNTAALTPIGELTCRREEISARLTVPERLFPGACTLAGIDGFLIRRPDNAASGAPVFWVAADPLPAMDAFLTPPAAPDEPAPEEPLPEPSSGLETAEKKSEIQARKIKRSDLTLLSRRFWPLANNSFLLHGYHNYNHLLLLEDNGRLWLGVPGIYDPREARAADLFGFPLFTREGAAVLDLDGDECSTDENFGHWCRCVR